MTTPSVDPSSLKDTASNSVFVESTSVNGEDFDYENANGSLTTSPLRRTLTETPASSSQKKHSSYSSGSRYSDVKSQVTSKGRNSVRSSAGSLPKDYGNFTSSKAQHVLDSAWLASQKEVVKDKVVAAQRLKKQRQQDEKAAALQLERSLPMDILTLDWFTESPVNSDLRIYLIDRLLPTLVLGMEKVLLEAEKFGLIDQDYPDDDLGGTFSPINFLAQYLMRNNPRFSHLNKNSPYVRGLKKVSDEMKRDIKAIEESNLAKLKTEAKRKRESVEEREKRKKEEAKERARLLKLQFPHWLVDSGRLQLQLVQNALYSYLEISSHLASDTDNVIHYNRELDSTDESGITVTVEGYIDYLEEFVCKMIMPEFVQLLRHLDHCAAAFRRTFEREAWRDMFVKLFTTIDSESCGYIDRHRMLHLLEKFWDKLEGEEKVRLHNPRKWPVIELEELDDLYPETDEDSGSDESLIMSMEEFASSEWNSMPIPGRKGGSGAEPSTSAESSQESSGKTETKTEEEKSSTSKDSVSSSTREKGESSSKNETTSAEKMETESSKVSSAAGLDANETVDEKPVAAPDSEHASRASTEKVEGPNAEEEKKSTTDEIVDEAEGTDPEHPEAQEEISPDVTDPVGEGETEEKVTTDEKPIDVVEATELPGDEGPGEAKIEELEEKEEGELPKEEDAEDKVEDAKEEKDAKEEEDAKDATREVGASLTASGTNLAATLITPAPNTEENEEAGAVNIQFSKEELQPKVRKTTSITTVQRKVIQPPEDQESTDALVTSGDQVLEHPGVAEARKQYGEKDSETMITAISSEILPASETVLVQETADDMPDYIPQPMEVKTRPGSTGRMSVTFAAEPLVLPDRPTTDFFSYYSSRSQSRMTSVFDENQLNEGRFITLLENFICDETDHLLVEQLVNFIHGGYVETEEEKMSRLEKARREVLSAKHRQMVDNLFNKWDNDGQGHLDNEEVDEILSKYKGGLEASAIKRARQAIRLARKNTPYHDRRRLNRREFHVYINALCGAMAGGEEVFDGLVEFLTTTVERTYTERVRGDARRKWLDQILASAETGGASMEAVYRAVFQTLRKDAESHGNQKKMSSYISLLENNTLHPDRGAVLLRYVACTPDNAPFMLGKAFYEDMQGISFYAVRRGKLVHVPRVQSHGRIYFWNPNREEGDREGSLVLVPIRDERRRTFGLLGVDNVDSAAAADRSIFASHEINFYQGVAKGFSSAFHHVDLRKKLLRIVDSAMSWVHSRAPRVRNIVVYFVEPDPKGQGSNVLRKMVTADNNTGLTITHSRPQRLYRKDNLFRDYLFKSMENSETTSADAYGERHTAYPLRDEEGRCQSVIDISIGKLRSLPKHENREVQRMLKLLQAANREVMKESIGGEKTVVLEAEEKGGEDARVDIMFDRLMLTDLRENVNKLDNNVFAELKNYNVPPAMIHNILKAVILIYNQDLTSLSSLEDWVTCKQMLTAKLRQWIVTYDPTSEQGKEDNEEQTDELVQSVGKLLKGIPHGAVAKQGSRPTQQLYNWAFVCLSLMEHAKKMRQNEGQPAITPVTSASTNTTQESTEVPTDSY